MLTDTANDNQTDEPVWLKTAVPTHLEPLGMKRLLIGVGAIVVLVGLGLVGAMFDVGVGAPSPIDGYRVGGK